MAKKSGLIHKLQVAGVCGSVLYWFKSYLSNINDIVNDIGANIRLLTDDTSLSIIVENHLRGMFKYNAVAL